MRAPTTLSLVMAAGVEKARCGAACVPGPAQNLTAAAAASFTWYEQNSVSTE